MSEDNDRLIDVILDEASLAPASANAEQERRVAMFDLKEANAFAVRGADRGPYILKLSTAEGRLLFEVSTQADEAVASHAVPLASLRRLIKDYGLICDSYFEAIRNAPPSRIEALDMGRRGLHNEAAEVLEQALDSQFKIDVETSRRLFTLICALHVRG